MKKSILISTSIILLLLTSCTAILFKTSQPKDGANLKEFPAKICGKYAHVEKDSETIEIKSNYIEYITTKKNLNDLSSNSKMYISDSLQLKQLKDYYIVSIKDKETGAWMVTLLKLNNAYLEIYYIDFDDKEAKATAKKLKKIIAVKEFKKENNEVKYYLIDPSKAELEMMIDKGFFKKAEGVKKIN